MTFSLTIELGNAAMRKGPDLAAALREVADDCEAMPSIIRDDSGPIRDANGNTVGSWEVSR